MPLSSVVSCAARRVRWRRFRQAAGARTRTSVVEGDAHWKKINIGDLIESVRLLRPDGTLLQAPADQVLRLPAEDLRRTPVDVDDAVRVVGQHGAHVELVEPGLVDVTRWRLDPPGDTPLHNLVGVGRKPA